MMGLRRGPAYALLILAVLSFVARAGLFGRDKIDARWTAAPLTVNGDDADWSPESAFEADGISVQARNDANDLYLLITAHTRDGHEQLTGEARENVALWAVAADGRTRVWGALLPFSHRAALTEALRDPAGVDPLPDYAVPARNDVSTGTWPAEIVQRLAISARRPVWELKIPRARLTPRPDGTCAFDFVVTGSGAVRPAPPVSVDESGRRRSATAVRGAPEGVALFIAVRPSTPPRPTH